MPDSAINELVAATQIQPQDLFVLEQEGTAKKLNGQTLVNWLTAYANGHGGIQSIVLASTSGRTNTYRITLSDTTTFEYQVQDGRGISNLSWATSGLAGNGQTHTGTFHFNDGTTSTIKIKDGFKGDAGDTYYTWIKYASVNPTSNLDMTDTPSDYIGIYTGTSSTAPTSYEEYSWYQCKGDKGDTGSPSLLTDFIVVYSIGNSGTTPPSDGWSTALPTVPQGNYLWTKISLVFNSGDPVLFYSVTRHGLDGSGSVSSINSISPDGSGNIALNASAIPNDNTNVAAQIAELYELLYGPNDVVSNIRLQAFGYVSTDNYVAINIILPRIVRTSNSITVTSIKPAMCVPSGGYLGDSSTTELVTSITSTTVRGNVLTVVLRKSNGWGTTANSPISGSVTLSFVVS